MIKLTRIQWARLKLSKYSYLFFYFRFRPGWELVDSLLRNLRPCVRVDDHHHSVPNCEIFIQPFAQPLCLIETPDRIKHFKTLYIHSPLFRISDPLNTISSQFVASKHLAIIFIWPELTWTSFILEGWKHNTWYRHSYRDGVMYDHLYWNWSKNLLALFSCVLTVAKNGYFILQGGLIYPKCVSVLTV